MVVVIKKRDFLTVVLLFVGAVALTIERKTPQGTASFKTAVKSVEILSFGLSASITSGRIVGKIADRLGVHDLIVEFFEDFVVVVGALFSVAGSLNTLGINTSNVGLSISAFVGFLVSFGFKDLLTNVSAGAWVSVIEPFKIGDRVKVSGYEGVVEEMNATNVVLRGDNGERVVIPAKNVWNAPIVKYNKRKD